MNTKEITFALREEIGEPRLFTGRKRELEFFLKWCRGVKRQLSQSTAILARRKRGKTAVIQRLFNTLYTWNDPQLIPFYFRPEETDVSVMAFSNLFYRSMLSQYVGFKRRDPALMWTPLTFDGLRELFGDDPFLLHDVDGMEETIRSGHPELAWDYARRAGHRISAAKDERIIQIIDEFQFLNRYMFWDDARQHPAKLCGGYHREAESKVSPQIITGSYIGWLASIIRHMVSRYLEYELDPLPDGEALEMVYNYCVLLEEPVTDETAPLIAAVCHNDPYYISQVIRSPYREKDLTHPDAVLATLDFETSSLPGHGQIAKMWLEYIWDAFERVNDRNAKAIVLYLARHGSEERSRKQIMDDLGLEMTDGELEEKLHKLVKADLLARGSSNYHYSGLGDPIFEIVFRRIFEAEIDLVDKQTIDARTERTLRRLQGQVSHYKGLAAEYRVMFHLLAAANRGASLADVVENPVEGLRWNRFAQFGKRSFHPDPGERWEVDGFLEGEGADACDFVLEVKDWERPVGVKPAEAFVERKKALMGMLDPDSKGATVRDAAVRSPLPGPRTGFIFYARNGFVLEARDMLHQNGIMTMDEARLVALSAG